MADQATTQLQITNISPDVSEFFLGLYLEKILKCDEVEVTHCEGNSVATVTVFGPGIDVKAAQLAADTEPLSNQRVTISLLTDGSERRGRTTASYRDSSLWSLPWTSASSGANVHDGVADASDFGQSSKAAGPSGTIWDSSSAPFLQNSAGNVSASNSVIPPDDNTKFFEAAPAKFKPENTTCEEDMQGEKETVSVAPDKWKLALFHLEKTRKNDDTFKVHIDEKKYALTVDIKWKLEVYEILSTIVEAPMPCVTSELGRVLSSKKGEKALDDSNIHGTICVRDDEVFLVTDSEAEVRDLRRLIRERKHTFFDVHVAFLKSKEWGHFKTQLSEKHLVDLVVNFEQHSITLSGINIDPARRELDKELTRNAQTKESMMVESTMGRYIKQFGQHQLKTVGDKWNVEIAVKDLRSSRSMEVEISGYVNSVKTAKGDMNQFLASLHKDTAELTVAGIRPLFRSEHGQTFLSGLETKETCTITIQDGKPSKELFMISTQEPLSSRMLGLFSSVKTRISKSWRHGKGDKSVRPKRKEENLSLDRLLFKKGGVSLLLSLGDVTEYQADVLVNTPVADCTSFSRGGAVTKAFLKKGGRKLEEEYFCQCEESYEGSRDYFEEESFGRGRDYFGQRSFRRSRRGDYCGQLEERSRRDDEVVHTAAHGKLRNVCRHVLHLKLRRWYRRAERSPSQMKLQAHIKDCLRRCVEEYNVNSIAFPTVGCGRYGYPVDKVVNAFDFVLKQFAKFGHPMKVTLVAYDRDIYKQVLEYFGLGDHTEDYRPSTEDAGDEDEVDEDDDAGQHTFAASGWTVAFPGKNCVPAFASVIFHVCGASRQSVMNAISGIEKHASGALPEDQIECPEPLSPSNLRRLENLNTDEVAVTVNQDRGVIRLAGMSQKVIMCRREIATILERGAYENLPEEKQRLFKMADQKFSVPKYWSKGSQKSRQKPGVLLADVSKQVRQAVETLVSKTWRGDVVGVGADARDLKHSTIKIKNVQRVENLDAWKEYDDKRKQFLREAALDTRPFPDIASLDGKQDVRTRGLNLSALDELVEPAINEVLLFHGTKEDTLEAITKQGLDFRMASSGFFGKGLYFAESSTKADQYADSKHSRTEGKHHMVLARVLLGSPYVCHKAGGGRQRPPCMTCKQSDCMTHQQFHNSVIGVGNRDGADLLFREFVIYDKGVCYPEFCITYERK